MFSRIFSPWVEQFVRGRRRAQRAPQQLRGMSMAWRPAAHASADLCLELRSRRRHALALRTVARLRLARLQKRRRPKDLNLYESAARARAAANDSGCPRSQARMIASGFAP